MHHGDTEVTEEGFFVCREVPTDKNLFASLA